mmetsp:Transcript_32616/g.74806  ORF Transcript_32616/g.74806 Transcript_32616/m.74806 type:complete len:228 (-) Transcript_32616:1471-2154(-)
MHRAMGVMLSGRFERIVTLNDVHCTITGFLPIHAVTASGVTSMYDFLLDLPGLPAQKRANSNQRTLVIKGKDNLEVTPLQLAARLGDHRMFKHIMRRRCKKLWKWGPVTQYVLDLTDIDSCGDSPHDVMELITAVDASTRTQEMLLDTFMDGIFNPFLASATCFRHMRSCTRCARELPIVNRLHTAAIPAKVGAIRKIRVGNNTGIRAPAARTKPCACIPGQGGSSS